MKKIFTTFIRHSNITHKAKSAISLTFCYFLINDEQIVRQKSLFPIIKCVSEKIKPLLKDIDKNVIIICRNKFILITHKPVASGLLIDEKTFLTINNIFQVKKHSVNHNTDMPNKVQNYCDEFYVKVNNQQAQEHMEFQIDLVLDSDNLAFCKLINRYKFQISDKEKLLKNKTTLERGDQMLLVSKSQDDLNVLQTGFVQDDQVRHFQEFQLPCISYLTDLQGLATSVYGSPITNLQGQFAGVVLPVQDDKGRFTYAMPQNYLESIIQQYQNNHSVRRPYLGMSIKSAQNGSQDGAFVIKVNSEGPAEKADVQLGDTIVSIDGIQVTESNDIFKILGYQLDKRFRLKLFKDGKFREVDLLTS